MVHTPASAEDVARAYEDNKLAQVLYHDWEAQTYDEKWSISFDDRCTSVVRDRFLHVLESTRQPGESLPYGRTLELGAGTGFFSLNLKLAGLVDEVMQPGQLGCRPHHRGHRHEPSPPTSGGDGVRREGQGHGGARGGLADHEAPASGEPEPVTDALSAIDVGASQGRVDRGELGRGQGGHRPPRPDGHAAVHGLQRR